MKQILMIAIITNFFFIYSCEDNNEIDDLTFWLNNNTNSYVSAAVLYGYLNEIPDIPQEHDEYYISIGAQPYSSQKYTLEGNQGYTFIVQTSDLGYYCEGMTSYTPSLGEKATLNVFETDENYGYCRVVINCVSGKP